MAFPGARVSGPLLRRYMGSASPGAGHGAGARTWKILAFVVALPGVGICMLNAWLQKDKHPDGQPNFIAYQHLRIRTKLFPWGDGNHSLFHNAHTNPLPKGYEPHGHKH